jgi:hypothetical protein
MKVLSARKFSVKSYVGFWLSLNSVRPFALENENEGFIRRDHSSGSDIYSCVFVAPVWSFEMNS